MIKIILCLLPFLINIDGPEPYTIMAISGLNMRVEPSLNSEVLKKLPFGSIIYSSAIHVGQKRMDERYKKDTINGVIGHWIDAEIKEEKIKGYVFSPYVYFGEIGNNDIDENSIRITQEGVRAGEMTYHPDLNWYGLYQRGDSYYLESIELKMILSKVNFVKAFEAYIEEGGELILLKTNKAERSEFLIGSKQILRTGLTNQFYQAEELGFSANDKNGFLYPEEKMSFYYKPYTYSIRAYEKISIDSLDFTVNRRYETDFTLFDNGSEIWSHSLGKDILLCCDAKKHANYQTPQVYWVGDINNDSYLDLILYQHTMTDGCGVCWTYSLFMSNVEGGKLKSLNFIAAMEDCNG